MEDLPDQLLERTRDSRLLWREDRFKPSQVARHFVASGYELFRFNDGSIQLVWKDEDQHNKSLLSRDSSLVLQLWHLASGETSIASVIAPQIAATPTDSAHTSYVYTRDYVKTCTVIVIIDDNDDHCGLLVSNAGHIVTTSEVVPLNAKIRVKLRGSLNSYDYRAGAVGLAGSVYEASEIARDDQLVLLKLVGCTFQTPNVVPTHFDSLSGTVWGGFRWWLLAGAIIEAEIEDTPDGLMSLDDSKVDYILKRFSKKGAEGSPLVLKRSGHVVGLVSAKRDRFDRIQAVKANRILQILNKAGVIVEDHLQAFHGTFNPSSASCSNYIERPEYEQLREKLLGDSTRYIRLVAPPLMGIDTLFKRFEFENVRFRFYRASVEPFRKTQAHEVLWNIIRDVRTQTANPLKQGRSRSTARAMEEFENFVYDELVKDTKLTIVMHIDHVESIIPNEDARNAFLTVLARLFDRRNGSPAHSRVRFAVTGHVRTEQELGALTKPEEMLNHIELSHFSIDETRELANLLSRQGIDLDDAAHNDIYRWTGGHPMLVQNVCKRIGAPGGQFRNMEAALTNCLLDNPDSIVQRLIGTLREDLRREPEALKAYSDFCEQQNLRVPFKTGIDRFMKLYRLGILKSESREHLVAAGEFFFRIKEKLLKP